MAEISESQLQSIMQQIQSALQASQEAKQTAQEIAQSIQDLKQGIQGSQQDKNTYSENKFEEINSGEALRKGVVVDAELWSWNKKLLAASEQSERTRSIDQDLALKQIDIEGAKLELARKQHDFAHQIKLDALHARTSEHAEVFKHAVNMEYAKFNSAVSEPLSPNTEA